MDKNDQFTELKIFIKTLLCTKGINPEKEIKVKKKFTTSTYVHVYKNSDEQIKTQIQFVYSNLINPKPYTLFIFQIPCV